MTTANDNPDALVKRCTAFSSLSELLRAVEGGYVPTLYPRGDQGELAALLRARGVKVWSGLGRSYMDPTDMGGRGVTAEDIAELEGTSEEVLWAKAYAERVLREHGVEPEEYRPGEEDKVGGILYRAAPLLAWLGY